MSRVRSSLCIAAFMAATSLALGSLALGQDSVTELTQRIELAQKMESEATYLNPLQIKQWVGLGANASITGKVVSLDDLGEVSPRSAIEVSLMRKGQAVSRAVSDADGIFEFKAISAGTYDFVAQSEYSFATFGIHVLPTGSGSPSSFEACVSMVSLARIRELVRDNWVPSETDVARVFEKDPLAGARKINGSPKVRLQNGDLLGQVSRAGIPLSQQDLTGNVAHVFKGGRSIAAAPTGRDGKFRIVGLNPGVYDLVVAGDDGYAVVGFQAVGPEPITGSPSASPARLVSVQDIPNVLRIELAGTPAFAQQPEELPFEELGMMDNGLGPFMGGGFGSSGGFGGGGGGLGGGGMGGGGFGGGGLGGLLGIAGLAAGVAALSNNDDFNPGQSTQFSF